MKAVEGNLARRFGSIAQQCPCDYSSADGQALDNGAEVGARKSLA